MSKLEFNYRHKPIYNINSLARTLNVKSQELIDITKKSNQLYIVAKKKEKPDGSIRVTYNAAKNLKTILVQLKKRIFDYVDAPDYILAGQKGRSYINNAFTHTKPKMLLCEDIKTFFPSIHKKYVKKIFQHFFCFSEEVSELLSELCTLDNYLVQGSPVSGEIANLVFFNSEPEVVEKLQNLGLRYTRYYDDIYVSSHNEMFYEHSAEVKSCIFNMFKTIELKPHRDKAKSKILKQSNRMAVHDVTVNSSKISPSKKRVSLVRKLLFEFQTAVKQQLDLEQLIKQYRSLQGHIVTLKSQGYSQHQKLKNELLKYVSEIDEKSAKKFARKLRKVKTKEQLKKLSTKISVLKKINPRVSAVIEAEKKSAKLKLI